MNTFARSLTIAAIFCAAAGLALALTGVSVHAGSALGAAGIGLAILRGPRNAPSNRRAS